MANSPNAPIGPGDVVILKCGGPSMAVEAMEVHAAENARLGKPAEATMARCLWHDSTGHIQNHLFSAHLLVADPESAKRKAAEAEADEKRAAELAREVDARRVVDEKRAIDLSKKQARE